MKIVKGLRADVYGETASKLAGALHVDERWLLRGVGAAPTPTGPIPPRPHEDDEEAGAREVVLDPRYARLERVIDYWRDRRPDRWSPEALEIARGVQLSAEEDPSVEEWEERLDGVEATIRNAARGRGLGGIQVRSTDRAVPPRGRRKA